MKNAYSLGEYIEIINTLSDDLHHDVVRNDTLLYRGHSNADYELIPSIGRKINGIINFNLVMFEEELINETISKLPTVFGAEKYSVDLLTKLQHFGIPTRLLDVTYNAFVALYFACQDNSKDGSVIVFKACSDEGTYIYPRSNDIVCIMASLYEVSGQQCYTFDEFIKILQKEHYSSIQKAYSTDNAEKEHALQLIFQSIQEPLCFAPLELSERQKRQQGAFFIFPNTTNVCGCRSIFNEIRPMQKSNRWLEEIIYIPAAKKELILRHLRNYGITQEFLFPDNNDIVCSSITKRTLQRFFMPSNPT